MPLARRTLALAAATATAPAAAAALARAAILFHAFAAAGLAFEGRAVVGRIGMPGGNGRRPPRRMADAVATLVGKAAAI